MRRLVIDAAFRPHITDGPCWCLPKVVTCTCDDDCGEVLVHRDVELTVDRMPHMSSYSEQRPL